MPLCSAAPRCRLPSPLPAGAWGEGRARLVRRHLLQRPSQSAPCAWLYCCSCPGEFTRSLHSLDRRYGPWRGAGGGARCGGRGTCKQEHPGGGDVPARTTRRGEKARSVERRGAPRILGILGGQYHRAFRKLCLLAGLPLWSAGRPCTDEALGSWLGLQAKEAVPFSGAPEPRASRRPPPKVRALQLGRPST
jgi:hypothetical protein